MLLLKRLKGKRLYKRRNVVEEHRITYIMKRSRHQFNMALDDDDYEILRALKDKYSININGCLKKFLRQYLEELESSRVISLLRGNKKHVVKNLQ